MGLVWVVVLCAIIKFRKTGTQCRLACPQTIGRPQSSLRAQAARVQPANWTENAQLVTQPKTTNTRRRSKQKRVLSSCRNFPISFAFRVMGDDFFCTWCSCWCVLIFFHLGWLLIIDFAHTYYLLRGIVFFHLVTHAHRPIPTPTHFARVCADVHRFTLKCWWLVGGGWCWTTCRDPPTKATSFWWPR